MGRENDKIISEGVYLYGCNRGGIEGLYLRIVTSGEDLSIIVESGQDLRAYICGGGQDYRAYICGILLHQERTGL